VIIGRFADAAQAVEALLSAPRRERSPSDENSPLNVQNVCGRSSAKFVAHYHVERNHQGLGNELIQALTRSPTSGPVRRRQRLGGMLNYYYRAA
jgi:hypothetical protein